MKKIEFVEDEHFSPFSIEPVQWLHVPLKDKVAESKPQIFAGVHLILHCSYLGTVYFEGEGIHSLSAALLMGITICGVYLGYRVASD